MKPALPPAPQLALAFIAPPGLMARAFYQRGGEEPAMTEREERLEAALERIVQWSEAYPLANFPEPDWKKARRLLEIGGISIDAVAASCYRHVVKGVGKIAREGLRDFGPATCFPMKKDDEVMPKHTLGDAPVEPRYYEQMNQLADVLDKFLNDDKKGKDKHTGFCLMVFPFEGFDGRANYISNANRTDIVTLLKEQLARFEGQPEMKGKA
jgi:hypothetical protein